MLSLFVHLLHLVQQQQKQQQQELQQSVMYSHLSHAKSVDHNSWQSPLTKAAADFRTYKGHATRRG